MRIGIIGCGAAGRSHALAYKKNPRVKVSAASDIDKDIAFDFGKEFDIPSYPLEELISKVDVIDIAAPTCEHINIARLAADMGKDIICETPLARTFDEAEEIVTLCSRAGARLAPVHFNHLAGPLSKVKEMVDTGRIDNLPMSRITRRRFGIPKSIGGWRGDFKKSGGVILDTLIHDIVFLLKTVGNVKRVYASTTHDREYSYGEYALLSLGFENGAIAHLDGSWMPSRTGKDEFEFAYNGGLIAYSEEAYAPLRLSLNDTADKAILLSPIDCSTYDVGLNKVCSALLDGGPLPVTAEEALIALEVALSAIESSNTGKVITLD